MHRRVYIFALLLFGLAGVLAPAACAEELPILGKSFPVDHLKRLDDSSTKLTLFGEVRIVRNKDLEEYVVTGYHNLGKLAGMFEPAELKDFIAKAVAEGRITIATLAFLDFLLDARFQQQEMLEFVESLGSLPGAGPFFQNVIASSGDYTFAGPPLVSLALFFAGWSDPVWARTSAVRGFYLYRRELHEIVEQRFQRAMLARDAGALEKILIFEREVYGSDDEQYRRLRVLQEKFTAVLERLKGEAGQEELLAAIELVRSNPTLQKALQPALISAIHGRARAALAAKDYRQALTLLALMDYRQRTPETFELLRALVKNLPSENPPVVADGGLRKTLLLYAGQDQYLKQLYSEFLEKQIRFLLTQQDTTYIEVCFEALLRNRSDPNEANDRLRREYASMLRDLGREQEAQTREADIQTHSLDPVAVGSFMKKFTRKLLPVSLAFVALFFVWVGYWLRNRQAPLVIGGRRGAPEVIEGPEDTGTLYQRFTVTNPAALDPRMREYVSCLQYLDLPPDADLKAIKAAYRNLVKECHPDTRQEGQGVPSTRFIEITRVYDRIMEIRKAMEGK